MQHSLPDWFTITDSDQVDTPALLVYPDRVGQNLELLKSMIDDTSRLRPHVKTHKCREAVLLTIKAGISKFKCATIAEAEMLGKCQAADVLLAYQPVGPKALRFLKLMETFPDTQFACLADNSVSAEELSLLALKNGTRISVYIDLNVGMNRTGIALEDALELYSLCIPLSGLKVKGLHTYDGHIHDSNLRLRIHRTDKYFKEVELLQKAIVKKGFPKPVIVLGGSATYPIHAKRKEVECSPGTFIYWDSGYQTAFAEQHFLTAALVIARVISLPDSTRLCIDLGHKSIASESELQKRILFLNAPELRPVLQSEEHLVMDAGADHTYKVGDLLYGLPYHICPTVALYERALTVENGIISGEWLNLARDRKLTI